MFQILSLTSSHCVIADMAGAFFGWHFIFALCGLFFWGGAFGLYFNFFPLNILNSFRTDTYRYDGLPAKTVRKDKFFSFIAYGFGGTVFIGVWFFSIAQGYQLTLDKTSNQVVKESVFLGDHLVVDTIALSDIKNAEIESSRGARLVLITRDGNVFVPLSSTYDDRDGYYQIRDAINKFLDVPSEKAQRTH